MKRVLFMLGLAALLGVVPCMAAPDKGYLHCRGTLIVDGEERSVLLQGFGLGGWLVPEGYMLQTSAQSPTQIRRAIVRLVGDEVTQEFYQQYEDNYISEEDIRMIASWGVNSLRLPFNGNSFWDVAHDAFRPEGFQRIDQLLTWCKKYGLYLILDMHCAPGGQNHQNISDSDGEARLWTEAKKYQPRTIEIWRQIAARYAYEPQIAGYDLLNEPVLPAGYNNKHLRSLYLEITQAIREVDQYHILFIEGNIWAKDFRELFPPWDSNLVYSFHKYWDENTVKSIEPYLKLREVTQAPLWMGESGENSNHWFSACITLLESHDIGWSWWAPKKIANITNPYSAEIPETYQGILDYWNGRNMKPTPKEAREGLFAMADSLKMTKCRFFPDVIDALIYPDKTAQAYAHHKAPGSIASVEYDLGIDGVAYHDRYSELTTGLQNYHRWNEGYQFRNDGVDIGLSNDAGGSGYYVGWIEQGEWLQYTVEFTNKATSDYDMALTAANVVNGGRIKILLDEKPLTEKIAVPRGKTGVWQRISLGRFRITPGFHRIRVVVEKGGFNIKDLLID